YKLRDPVARAKSLHVVLVAVDHQRCPTLEHVPERLHVALVPVDVARAVAGPMPEREATCSRAPNLRAQPPKLARPAAVRVLGVEAQDLPACRAERVVGRNPAPADPRPVRVIAARMKRPLVVAGCRRDPTGDRTVDRSEVAGELARSAELV